LKITLRIFSENYRKIAGIHASKPPEIANEGRASRVLGHWVMAGWVRGYGFVGNRHWSAGFPSDHRTWRIGPPWAHGSPKPFRVFSLSGHGLHQFDGSSGLCAHTGHGLAGFRSWPPPTEDWVPWVPGRLYLWLPLLISDSPSLKLSLSDLSVSRSLSVSPSPCVTGLRREK